MAGAPRGIAAAATPRRRFRRGSALLLAPLLALLVVAVGQSRAGQTQHAFVILGVMATPVGAVDATPDEEGKKDCEDGSQVCYFRYAAGTRVRLDAREINSIDHPFYGWTAEECPQGVGRRLRNQSDLPLQRGAGDVGQGPLRRGASTTAAAALSTSAAIASAAAEAPGPHREADRLPQGGTLAGHSADRLEQARPRTRSRRTKAANLGQPRGQPPRRHEHADDPAGEARKPGNLLVPAHGESGRRGEDPPAAKSQAWPLGLDP